MKPDTALSLPSKWQLLRNGVLFRERRDKNHPDLEMYSVSQAVGVVPQSSLENRVTAPSEDRTGYNRIVGGDLVYNKMRMWQGAVGVAPAEGIVSTAYVVMEPRRGTNSKYFEYLYKTPRFITESGRFSYGLCDDMNSLRAEHFKSIESPVPPLPVQDAIVRYLDSETSRIDSLIDRKQRFIELLLEKRTALITHAVTKGLDPDVEMKDSGIDFIGYVPVHWDVAPLYARYEVTLGKMLDAKQIIGENLAPYVRNADVQWDCVNTEDLDQMDFDASARLKFRLRPGDLLVCEGGEVGRTAIWRGELDECYYQKAIHRLRPRSAERDVPRFFYYVMLASALGERFTVGSNVATIGHLTATQLRHHRFGFPPVSDQKAIVDELDIATGGLDLLADKTRKSIELLSEYRTALISAAVTGQIEIPAADSGEDVA